MSPVGFPGNLGKLNGDLTGIDGTCSIFSGMVFYVGKKGNSGDDCLFNKSIFYKLALCGNDKFGLL
jgi:hypothetical protein